MIEILKMIKNDDDLQIVVIVCCAIFCLALIKCVKYVSQAFGRNKIDED